MVVDKKGTKDEDWVCLGFDDANYNMIRRDQLCYPEYEKGQTV